MELQCVKKLQDQILPDNYTIPFNINELKDGFNIYDFIGLLSDKCAAFFIESEYKTNYKVIFNTYNFMAIYDEMSLNNKFKFRFEQKKREFYASPSNFDKIIMMNPLFMVIYMYAENGYRIGAVLTDNGIFEFGGYASPAFYAQLMANKTQIST